MTSNTALKDKKNILDFPSYAKVKQYRTDDASFIDKFDEFTQKQDELYEMVKSIQKNIEKSKDRDIDIFIKQQHVKASKKTVTISNSEEYIKGKTHNFSDGKEYVDGGTNMMNVPNTLVTMALKSEPFVQELYCYMDGDIENYVIVLNNNNVDITSRITDIYWDLFDEFEEQIPNYLFEFNTRDGKSFNIGELPKHSTRL